MSDFDPIRALREEIAGLADVAKVIAASARASEAELAEAEAKAMAMMKMAAFMAALLDDQRARLKALEDNAAK